MPLSSHRSTGSGTSRKPWRPRRMRHSRQMLQWPVACCWPSMMLFSKLAYTSRPYQGQCTPQVVDGMCLVLCLQDSFGSDAMLGSLDENDPDMGDDDGEAEAMDEDDELTAALARTHI